MYTLHHPDINTKYFFGLVNVQAVISLSERDSGTRGHKFKVYKKDSIVQVRWCFSRHIIMASPLIGGGIKR